MFKKLVYVSLLLLAFIIAACGSGVATYPPPNKTETIEAAFSDDSHSSEPTEQVALPTEPSATETEVEDTIEPTAIEAVTIEPTIEASVATIVVEDTSVPPTLPPTEVEALASETPTEVPDTIATDPVSTSRAEIATIATTDTPEPTPTVTNTATDTPEPTATITNTATNTPEPTATITNTATATDTPEPTATVTNTATDTPEPTATVTNTATDTPEPTATVTNTATDTPEPTATITNTATDTPEPTATITNTATDIPEPTATITNTATDTPEPTATITNTATDTPEPTATVTNTATDTPEPTATVTNTATDTPEPTATITNTATDTPEPTATITNTATDTPEPTATVTNTATDTPEPVELEPYENESLGLTFDYSPAWSEPIEDDNAIIIIPSEDIEDISAGNVAILRGTPEEIADEFIVEVNIDTPEVFLESLADDLENVEISEVELADGEITAIELIGVSEEENQTIRAIVVDLEDEWIVIIGIAPTEIFDMFSADVMDVILQNLDIGERAISEPVESTQYEGEAVGLEFEYQADSEIERDGNTLSIDSTFRDITGNIFIARGTPEDLLDQGHIGDDSNPRAALLSLEPETDPFVSDQFNPSFQAWTITIETTDGDDTYTERLYIVAIRTEWVFIRTSALSENFDEADENIFAPLLESIIILDEIPE